jgi:hypothetical protein
MQNFTLKNTKIVITSKTKSGKSELLRFLLMNDNTNFYKTYLFCPTEKINSFYKDLIPDENVFEEFEEDWLNKLIQKMTSKNGSNKQPHEKKDVLIIFDDCSSDADFTHSKALKRLFTRGRHLNISVIMTSQYIYQIPPVCRSNVDYAIVGQMNFQSLELLTSEYLLGTITKKEFIDMYHRCTSNYQFLVINNNSVKDNSDKNQIYGTIKVPEEFLKVK